MALKYVETHMIHVSPVIKLPPKSVPSPIPNVTNKLYINYNTRRTNDSTNYTNWKDENSSELFNIHGIND